MVGQCYDGRLANEPETQMLLMRPVIPDKMSGCSFNFCCRITEPYVEEGCTQGLEMEMLSTLKSILQFEVKRFFTFL